MAFKILTIANMELPFWKLPSGDTVDNRVPYSMSIPPATFTGAGALQQIGITASDIERIRAGYNPFDILRANGVTQSNPLVSDNVTFYGGSSALRGYIGSNNLQSNPLYFKVRVWNTLVPICVVDDNNDISIVSMDKVGDEWKLYVNYYGGDHGIDVGLTNNQSPYRLLRDFDWGDAPEPERSNLDMFDITQRFSPRVAQDGIGCWALNKTEMTEFTNDLYRPSNATYFSTVPLPKPWENILTCRFYHGMIDDVILRSGKAAITCGGFNFGGGWNSAGSAHKEYDVLQKEWSVHDFGEINISRGLESASLKRGNFLDYAPFVKYQLYLPYVGYCDVNPNDIIDGIVGIKLNVNFITGQGLYIIYTRNNSHHTVISGDVDEQVILTVPCTLGIEVPFTANMYGNVLTSIVRTIGTAGSIGISGGLASGVASAGATANALLTQAKRLPSEKKEERYRLEDRAFEISNNATQSQIAINSLSQGMNVLDIPPTTGRSGGGFNSDIGTLGSLQPFFIITFPIVATPDGFEDIYGNRCAVIDELSNCQGFTQIVGVTPDDNLQPNKYQSEIIALLQSGVYL